ncbi:MAG: transporter substrate-binding domain-containing protein [Deltaproteobacteria bacterium]|nr:transporter substrate-binding domain-containing protein [Deltaproteobacteria bacterium]
MTTRHPAVWIFTWMFLLLASPCHAQEVVVVTEDFPPYNYIDPNTLKITGICTEVVLAVFKELGQEPDIRVYPWVRAYQMALKEKNVLIYSMKRTEQRENLFKWAGELYTPQTYFIAYAKEPFPPVSSIDELKGFRIGVLHGGAVDRALRKNGFQNVEGVSDRIQNWKKLKMGRIDFWCTCILSARYLVTSSGDQIEDMNTVFLYEELSRDPLYMAFSAQTDDAIVDQYRQAYQAVMQKGIYAGILKGHDMRISGSQ